jgi:hypothetical protein
MLKTMMGGSTPGAEDPAAENEAKADDLCQGHGRVWPQTKESHAETIAHLLKIQPGIQNTVESSSKRPVARV